MPRQTFGPPALTLCRRAGSWFRIAGWHRHQWRDGWMLRWGLRLRLGRLRPLVNVPRGFVERGGRVLLAWSAAVSARLLGKVAASNQA